MGRKTLIWKLPATQIGLLLLIFGIHGSFDAFAQEENVLRGKVLAQSYCASCHTYPEPSLLPKNIWTSHVLPQMAAFMGNQEAQDSLGVWETKSPEELALLNQLNVYPATAQLSDSDFQLIVDYYQELAPDTLPDQEKKSNPIRSSDFLARSLFIEGIQAPKTSMVAINEDRGELLLADASSHQLFAKNQDDELFSLPSSDSPIVHFTKRTSGVYNFFSIGTIEPSDLAGGGMYEMDLKANSWTKPLENLSRPVFGIWSDLEGNGQEDLLICNYGNHQGAIAIYPKGSLQSPPKLLKGSGARKVEVADLNLDGLPDIVALFCQGDERISVFFNQGNGEFGSEKILLKFSPVFGSSYFELQDMNGDGYLDILMSNGDNWDYSAVKKPYHGFRIFENNGHHEFYQRWFFPQYGAVKAMATDFDGDGDLDIASLAFYDDLSNPEEQFLIFENTGNGVFVPKSIPEAALGKWLTMDVGDLDGDGDEDIVLGAYIHNFREYTKILRMGIQELPSVLILENVSPRKDFP